MKSNQLCHIVVDYLPTKETFDFTVNKNLDNFTCFLCNHGNCRHIIWLKKDLDWVKAIVNPSLSQRFCNWMDTNIIPFTSMCITFCAVVISLILWRYL